MTTIVSNPDLGTFRVLAVSVDTRFDGLVSRYKGFRTFFKDLLCLKIQQEITVDSKCTAGTFSVSGDMFRIHGIDAPPQFEIGWIIIDKHLTPVSSSQ